MPEQIITTRDRIALLIYSMVNAVLFGIGLVIVLNVPAFAAHLWIAIPAVVLIGLVLAAPIAWLIAPRLRARRERRNTGPRLNSQPRSSVYPR
jgi:hypothetical protein